MRPFLSWIILFVFISSFVAAQVGSISGPTAICAGSAATYTNPTTGGTWSISNTAIASVGSSSGVVTGITAGTVVITYTASAGFATYMVTVMAVPSAITGTALLCNGASSTLSCSPAGGTWTSGNPSIATVSSGGVVIGTSNGTTVITYTQSTGCFTTRTVTVAPNPAPISGPTTLCTGMSITLTDATPGGTWTSSIVSIATVSSASGIVTGVAAGAATISYTASTGCFVTYPITVNSTPNMTLSAYSICVGGTSTLSSTTGGGIWSSSNSAVAAFGTGTTITGVSAGVTNISYVVSSGCYAWTPLNVYATSPTVYTVTGGGAYCSGGAGVTVGLSGSQTGVIYQLYRGIPVGSAVSGTGSPLSFGNQTTAGAYSVTANAGTTCATTMSGTVSVSVNPLPTSFTVTGGGFYTGTALGIGLSGSQTGVTYQLMLGSTSIGAALGGSGSALSFGTYSTTGIYTVAATDASTLCFRTMTGSAVISTTVTPYSVTGGGGYCAGSSGVTVGLSNSQTGVMYQLYLGATAVGSPVSGTGGALSFGLQSAAGTYTVIANPGTSSATNMTGSAVVVINSLPTAYTLTGGGSYCSGGTGVPIILSGSNMGISYYLYCGAALVGFMTGTGTSINFGLFTTVGTYTAVGINATTACAANMAGSVTVSVSSISAPMAFATTGGGSMCAGGVGVPVGLFGSQSGVSYQLYRGSTLVGAAVAGTGSAISFGLQTVAGVYQVLANSGTSCSAYMVGSATVTVNPSPNVFTVTGGGSYCSGGTGVNVGLNGSQTGVSYQLYRGGSPVGSTIGGTGSAISFGLQTVAGTYTVLASQGGCTSNMTGSATVTVTTSPAVFAVTGGGSYCTGGTGVSVGLSGSQAGVSYQLYNGVTMTGSAISGTGAALSFGLQTLSGTYTVIANPGTSCSASMSGSAVVNAVTGPTAFAVTGGGSYCTGSTGVLVGLSGSQAGISYQLEIGGSPVGTAMAGTGSSLSFGMQTMAGTYTVTAYAGTTCSAAMTGSAIVTASPGPTDYAFTGGGAYCTGGGGVVIGLVGTDAGVSYQLKRTTSTGTVTAGSPVTGTGAAISFGLQTTPGLYTVLAADPSSGCSATLSGSTSLVFHALPAVIPVTGGGSYCTGGAGVAVTMPASAVGVNYQLYRGGVAVGSPVGGVGYGLSFGLQTVAGSYTVVATDLSTGCTNNMSGSALVNVYPVPASYSMTGGGGYCAGTAGVVVGLSGSALGVNYQLYRGGVALSGSVRPGTGSAISFGPQTAGVYTAVAASGTTGCTSNMTGSVTVTLNTVHVYTITGGGSYCSGGAGVNISLNNSDAGVNYQLRRSGVAVGSPVTGTGTLISFGAQTIAGSYTVTALDGTTGCSGTMAGSVSVAVNALPSVYAMTGGGSYCSGGAGVLVGLSGSQPGVNYQLLLGGVPSGTAVAGTGGALNFGLKTTAGSYTVTAMSTAGCTDNMSGTATVTVNTLPTVFAMSGGGTYCTGGSGLVIGLTGSQTGVNYQLRRGTVTVGSPIAGTGSALSFGLQTVSGTYTVTAVNPTTGCTASMSGSTTISSNPSPTICTMTGGGGYCSGGSGVSVGLGASIAGTTYQLYRSGSPVGSPVGGVGGSLSFGLQTVAGTYTAVATNSFGCTANMSGSATVTVYSLPTAYNVTGGGSYCTGGTGLHIYLSGSATGTTYRVYQGVIPMTSPVPGTGASLDFGLFTAAGTYTVVATTSVTGCTNTMTGTANISINPVPAISGSIYTVAPAATITLSGSPSGGSWSSSVTTIAGVGSSSGVVTGISLGTTMITYTLATGCFAVHSVAVTPTGHRGMAEEASDPVAAAEDIRLFPNPGHGMLTIQGRLPLRVGAVRLSVVSLAGQTVYNKEITADNGSLNDELDMQILPPGNYVLQLQYGDERKTFSVVIQ